MATTDMTLPLESIERNSSLLRRNSTGNFGNETTPSKAIPHYRLASAHSCHDYCKYGNTNPSEAEARINPFPQKFSVIPDKIHNLAGPTNVVPRNRKPVLTSKPSHDVKSQIQLNKCEVVKKEIPRSLKKVEAIQKQVFEPKLLQMKPSSPSVIRRHSDSIIPTKDLGARKVRPLGSPSSRRNIELGLVKDTNSPKTSKKSHMAVTVSASPKSRVKTVLSKKTGNINSPRKVLNIAKQKSFRKVEATKKSIEEDVPEKTLYVVESSAETYVVESSAETRSNISLPSPKSEKEGSIKSHSEMLNPKSPDRKEDKEPNFPDQRAETKRRPIRVGKMTSDNGECSPRKMKFKRGKVVTVGSESSSPRKLKFKPGKVLDDNQHVRDDKRRVGRVQRLVSVGEFNNNKAESPKVVLRHQEVEERKDTQSLFNNVIEETASKLVETRKSKVKALVGAFESLTSLKDTKPSEVS